MDDQPRAVDDPLRRVLDADTVPARVLGIGEAAHFVTEFNVLRAEAVADLVARHGFTHLALEVGHDEAPLLDDWLRSADPCESTLRTAVGPLTFMLYGTFLLGLVTRLGARSQNLSVLGVDLPNSLRPEASLAPLAELLNDLDPDAAAGLDDVRRRCSVVTGGSAAACALAWMALSEEDSAVITAELASLRERARALGPLYEERSSGAQAQRALDLADSAVTTVLMLRAMADLFSGRGRTADTSLRESFIASRITTALAALPATARIAYVAHNNHIQKTPVVFDSTLIALSAGTYLARELGHGYRAIALTHLGEHVPEMEVTGAGELGFEVAQAPMPPPGPDSVEALALAVGPGDSAVVAVTTHDVPAGDPGPQTIRSQSAVAHGRLGEAFDSVLVTRAASPDRRCS
jgi:erythromycin esterase